MISQRGREILRRYRERLVHKHVHHSGVSAWTYMVASVAMVSLTLGGCSTSQPSSHHSGSATAAAFCTAAVPTMAALETASSSGSSPSTTLSSWSSSRLTKTREKLSTMSASAPAAVRGDVDQLARAWSQLLTGVLSSLHHAGSAQPATPTHGASQAAGLLAGRAGVAVNTWTRSHCRGFVTPAVTTTTTTLPPSSLPTPLPSTPDLFVSTAATPPPGQLYSWPNYPTKISLDNSSWIGGTSPTGGISWVATPTSAAGLGTAWSGACTGKPGNNCTHTSGSVSLSASQPQTCTVTYEDPTTGATNAQQVEVFSHFQYRFTSGASAGRTFNFPSPCSGAPGIPQSISRCPSSALSVQAFFLAAGSAAGSTGGAFGLTNHGAAPCTLYGFPGLQLVSASGALLPTTVIRGQYEVVSTVPDTVVTLAPGAQAYTYFMYSHVLGGGAPSVCPPAETVDVTPPGAYHSLVVHFTPASSAITPCKGHVWVSAVTLSTPFSLVPA